MNKEKKKFESFPVRPIRISDETWKSLKERKNVSGLTWNKFVSQLLETKE